MESAAKFIQNVIQMNCVVIFTKPGCPHCRIASEVFNKIGIQYETVDISKHQDTEGMQKVFHTMTGECTVPRVFVNGVCIGGGKETKELYESNLLQKLIANCKQK